ncbi:MAG TPA: DsbA family oxidoreductase, partial [Leptospiraceae bacterium]|nr:DsbA family oxidoreductase [Leptospiraceae bacterium]
MKVEIWSDVMCPFCYIGKRKFERALAQFPERESIEIEWKSFQLNPGMKTEPGKSINEYLAEVKGWSVEEAKKMNDRVSQIASAVGITFNFDQAIVANSFDAHRLSHMAKKHGLQDQMEERLFAAYFTEG